MFLLIRINSQKWHNLTKNEEKPCQEMKECVVDNRFIKEANEFGLNKMSLPICIYYLWNIELNKIWLI